MHDATTIRGLNVFFHLTFVTPVPAAQDNADISVHEATNWHGSDAP